MEGHIQEIVEAMHKMLLKSPSVLLQAALVDGVGETRTQNQPGTSSEYSTGVCRWQARTSRWCTPMRCSICRACNRLPPS